jgi:macrolide transport system ATP-binding/permease protein
MRIGASLDNIRTDVRHALRSLRRSPGFAVVAILALAVGIGGNTAIFSVIDATREQAIPYADPERLVYLIGNARREVVERRGASYPDFVDWRAQQTGFEDLAAFDPQLMSLTGADETERIDTEFVSASYFSLLGVTPTLGRTFRPEEDDVAKPSMVIVLSDGLWRRRFGADPQILGRPVTLNGQPYTVLGVMPAGFSGVTDEAQLWIPFARYAPQPTMHDRATRGFTVLGRLEPGVTMTAAQAELDAIASRLAQAHPVTNAGRGIEVSPLATELFGQLRLALQLLMAAIAFVLIIACANVANLLIARSEVRRKEIALRVAIGAGRARLMQQLVTESCVLTLLGAAGGLLLAQATIGMLMTSSPVTFPSLVTPGLDLRVAAFTIAVSLLCGIAVGLAPWWQTRIVDLSTRLRESARTSDGPRSQRLRNGLVVAEVALAIVLMVGASLMIQSVRNLAAIDPGFDPASLLTVHISLPSRVPPPAGQVAAQTPPAPAPPAPVVTGRDLLERIRAVPGVVAAGLGSDVPLDGNGSASLYVAEGHTELTGQNRPRTWRHRVSPDFFDALGIPFVNGRTFLDSEATPDSSAVIVSEKVAARFWPGQDPIGKRVRFGDVNSDVPWLSIVGVVGEVKYRSLRGGANADPDVYQPFADRNSQIAFVIRTSVPSSSVVASVREAIRSANPSIAIYGVAPMDERVRRQSAPSRFITWVLGVFAGIALWLCALGIYGVMSYVVTQRTREIGIRLALGAQPREVLAAIVAGGARLMVIGVVLGGIAAAMLRRAAASQLFDVPLTDPAAALAVLVFGLVGLAACVIPGLRATRLDPVRALHQE